MPFGFYNAECKYDYIKQLNIGGLSFVRGSYKIT